MLDRKREPPKWFYERPELLPGQYIYIEIFDKLTTCRSVGSGAVGRIPWTALYQYALAYDFDQEELSLLETVVYKLDSFYIDWVHKEMKNGGGDDA